MHEALDLLKLCLRKPLTSCIILHKWASNLLSHTSKGQTQTFRLLAAEYRAVHFIINSAHKVIFGNLQIFILYDSNSLSTRVNTAQSRLGFQIGQVARPYNSWNPKMYTDVGMIFMCFTIFQCISVAFKRIRLFLKIIPKKTFDRATCSGSNHLRAHILYKNKILLIFYQ